MKTDKPNILIFMTDHQRGDTVFKNSKVIMPNVKKLAAEGISFTNTYCPMAHCCPSRASFFSGVYPSRHGVFNNVCNDMAISRGLKEDVRLFSQDLKEDGYNLAFAGKWHVSYIESPRDRGFEELMISSANEAHHGRNWEDIQNDSLDNPSNLRNEGVISKRGYRDDVLYGINENAAEHDVKAVKLSIEKIKEYASGDSPWLVYTGLNMPHAPYYTPQKYLDLYSDVQIDLPESYHDNLSDKPNYYRKLREMRFDQLSENEVIDAIKHFYAMCTYIDDLFGELLKSLEETNQVDNTIILFVSDHGDYLGEHGLFHKGVPSFKGAYNIPAVLRWPKGIKNPGREINELVSLIDFAPTFLECSNINSDRYFSGKSLLPFFEDERNISWRDMLFTQCNGVENYFTQRIAFSKDYKYVYNGFDYDEFYDLKTDPNEMINLNNDNIYDEIKHKMVREMWKNALKENDPLGTAGGYIMVSTAPWGPEEAFL